MISISVKVVVTCGLILNIYDSIGASASASDSSTNEIPLRNPIPYALSPTYLAFLARQESLIYTAMKEYTKALEKRMKLLKRYTEDYEATSLKADRETEDVKVNEIASNPTLSYRMLHRYSNEFLAIGESIRENAERVSSEIVYEAKGPYDFPSESDARDAIEGILRMQFMYNLRASDLAEGIIAGVVSNPIRLTTPQCHKIAHTARRNRFYTMAVEWFNVTRVRLQNATDIDPRESELVKEDGSIPTAETVSSEIHQTIAEHNRNFQEAYNAGHEHIYISKIRKPNLTSLPKTYRDYLIENMTGKRLNDSHHDYFLSVFADHVALCNGANFQTESERKKLKCWYDTKKNPYWTINPVKTELLNSNPPVVQMYDMISGKWMKYFKNLAYSQLDRAPSGPNATPRTAAYAWFHDRDIPEAPISRRLELLTGLNVRGSAAAEALQIAAYSFGGHVELHYDSKGPDDLNPDPKGDRVTTFLAYLNDVEQGGFTAFPRLGFHVKPVMGSAVLWYTNLQNGDVDPATIHGACPLIHGHKWIATKWTHVNQNIFKRPCALNPAL